MAIWPWRTKPTAQPWGDNYKIVTGTTPGGLTPIALPVTSPDNLFLEPITIAIALTNVAGVRVTQYLWWTLYRDGQIIARSHYTTNTLTGLWFITYAHNTTYGTFAAQPLLVQGLLPDPFPVLPNDILIISVTGGLAGDTLNTVTIQSKAWEIY